ncbi:MAG: tripartite tricarboxylate transporter substrate binding protein [Bradyrhizobiaceae bacterium]|nr:tripartite tricarboxylate transporter substrate binding protein [Bradyrhizobiaceae bacterium]
MQTRRRFLRLAGAAAAVPVLARDLQALDYPSRPVRIVVAFGPGGPTDIFARLVAQRLSETFGKQFFVENVGGGGGSIGATQVARSAPDGQTLLFTVSAFVSNVAFHGKAPYDPIEDFVPVALPAASAMTITVHPSLGVATLDELIALVRANPGRYPFASGGAGAQPHLAFERFRLSLGLDMTHVPFSGAGPEVTALVAGHVPIGISSLPPCVPHIQAGRLRGLVVTSRTRSTKVPDVPTALEVGYPILEGDQWIGVLAPAGTPGAIVQLLHSSITAATASPEVKERLEAVDIYPVETTPQDFAARIRSELEMWRRVVQEANLTPG